MPADPSAALEHLGRVAPRSERLWPALRSLGPALAACPAALERLAPPAAVAELWRRDFVQTRARNLVLLAELETVLAALAADGVETALFKGAAALDRLYPDPGSRPMDDADVLVRPADRARAAEHLGRLGFALRPAEPGRFGQVDDALHGEWTFVKPVGPLEVELDLHWHLVADARLRRLFPGAEDAGVWARALPATLGDAATLRLAPSDAALATAVAQVLGHPWSHPLGYLDLWLELGEMTPTGRRELLRRAVEAGLGAPLWWSLRFVERLFGPVRVADSPSGAGGLGAGDARIGRHFAGVGKRGVDRSWAGVTGHGSVRSSDSVTGHGSGRSSAGVTDSGFGRSSDGVTDSGVGRSSADVTGYRFDPSAEPASDVDASVCLRCREPIGAPPPAPAPAAVPAAAGRSGRASDGWDAELAPPVLSRRLVGALVGGDWLGLAPFRREMAARDLFVLLLAGPGGLVRGLAGPTSAGRVPDPRGTARAVLALARAAGRALSS